MPSWTVIAFVIFLPIKSLILNIGIALIFFVTVELEPALQRAEVSSLKVCRLQSDHWQDPVSPHSLPPGRAQSVVDGTASTHKAVQSFEKMRVPQIVFFQI